MKRVVLFCISSLLPFWVLAESDSTDTLDPVVITATRTNVKEDHIANTVTVITAEEIKARRINFVAEILRTVPGLDVISGGGTGQQTSVFTRGSNSNQTLVLIDNIRMNDPGNPNNSFDFANLQVDDIERIEILRGAASSMWGADAMGGVIHIITKHGKGPANYNGMAEGGNYNTWKVGGGVSGEVDQLSYSVDASHLSNLSVSAAAQSMGNRERDPYQNTTFQSRFNYKVTEDLDLDWSTRYNQAGAGMDNCGGFGYKSYSGSGFVPCDNRFYYNNANQLYTRGQGRWFLFDRFWEQRFGVNYTMSDRQTYYTSKTISPDWTPPGTNNGEETKVEWLNFLHFNENETLLIGAEGRFDSLYSQSGLGAASSSYNNSMNNGGYYIQNDLDWLERFHTTAGARIDSNSIYGSHSTWKFNQVMAVPETSSRIKANIGTAFRAPSLCEISKQCYGNPNLMPETSIDWDAGIEQDFMDRKATAGVVYFDNNYNNLIQWNPSANGGLGSLSNIGTAIARGVETFAEYKPMSELSFRINYTYDETFGQNSASTTVQGKQPLLLRPKNKGNFDVDYRFLPEATVRLNILAYGSRSSYDTLGGITQVPGYVLVNLSTNYELNQNVTLFARLDNLLNKQYQMIWGYGALGFNGLGGFTVKF